MALAVVAVVAFSGIVRAAEIEIGTAAPDFTAKGVDGKDVTLKGSLKDAKGVVVCFTCNNCPVAVEYEDRFIDFAKKYNGKGIKFLAINVNTSEDLEKMKVRAEEKGFNFPYAYEARRRTSSWSTPRARLPIAARSTTTTRSRRSTSWPTPPTR
jgi:peroxiredoxin